MTYQSSDVRHQQKLFHHIVQVQNNAEVYFFVVSLNERGNAEL